MKRFKSITICLSALAFMGVLMTSCTKEGPQGPAGPPGENGVATCGQCHDLSTDLYAKIIQYENSTHLNGGNFERSTTSCAPCHTHEGFVERMDAGTMVCAADIEDPTPPNCRTCHKIHETYTDADYDLTYADPAMQWIDNTVSHDIGMGNICANCHQARTLDPTQIPDPANPTDSITITSSRYGYHHGPQYNMLMGEGGYRTAGGNYATPTASHKNNVADGCTECHMGPSFGNQAGGHTWFMTYDYHGSEVDNVAACENCHPGESDFDINGVQTEIAMLLDSLGNMLVAAGIQTSSGSAVSGTYTAELVGARLNWQFVEEDRSLGVHNYEYAKALLINSINAL